MPLLNVVANAILAHVEVAAPRTINGLLQAVLCRPVFMEPGQRFVGDVAAANVAAEAATSRTSAQKSLTSMKSTEGTWLTASCSVSVRLVRHSAVIARSRWPSGSGLTTGSLWSFSIHMTKLSKSSPGTKKAFSCLRISVTLRQGKLGLWTLPLRR